MLKRFVATGFTAGIAAQLAFAQPVELPPIPIPGTVTPTPAAAPIPAAVPELPSGIGIPTTAAASTPAAATWPTPPAPARLPAVPTAAGPAEAPVPTAPAAIAPPRPMAPHSPDVAPVAQATPPAPPASPAPPAPPAPPPAGMIPPTTMTTPANAFMDPFFAAPGGAAPGQLAGNGTAAEALFLPRTPVRPARVFGYADFFYAASQGTIVPPLVVRGPANVVNPALLGVTSNGVSIINGNRRSMKDMRPGFRLGGGFYLDSNSIYGFDLNLMAIEDTSDNFAATGAIGGLTVARPVINGLTNTNIGIPLGTVLPQTITTEVANSFWTGDANFRYNLVRSDFYNIDLVAGYRYADLSDSVYVSATQVDQLNVGIINTAILLGVFGGTPQVDDFRTRNRFHGGQIGFSGYVRVFERITVSGRGTVALGANYSEVLLRGSATSGGVGLLVQPSNAGLYQETEFAVVPELVGKLGFDATDRLRFNVGYAWTYWSKVRRAADQIDLTVLAPGRPSVGTRPTTDYWVHGLSLGMDWRW